jgi:hypothetical protein
MNNFQPRCQWLTPVIPATWEAEIKRIVVQGQSRQIVQETPSPKWTGGMAQVVECQLCKWKALSSNPNPTKKNLKMPINWKKIYVTHITDKGLLC